MATGAEAAERIAAAAGLPVGVVAGKARALKEARRDLWPLAGKGGGKSGAHVEPHHLANLFPALASPQPIEAVEHVTTLRKLRYAARTVVYLDPMPSENPHPQLRGQVQDRRDPENRGFGEWLERLIDEAADPAWRRAWAIHRSGTEISLCVSPAAVEVSWPTSDGIHTDHFLPPEQELPFTWRTLPLPKRPARHVLILPYDVITAAGELWEDTVRRCGIDPTRTPPSPEGDTHHGAGETDDR